MIAAIDHAELRERLRLIELVAIADQAHDARRLEARAAAAEAFERNEPACMFQLRFQRAMLTGQPF
jgi:hypothetical protein